MNNGVSVFFFTWKNVLSTNREDGVSVCIDNDMNFALHLFRRIGCVSKKIFKKKKTKMLLQCTFLPLITFWLLTVSFANSFFPETLCSCQDSLSSVQQKYWLFFPSVEEQPSSPSVRPFWLLNVQHSVIYILCDSGQIPAPPGARCFTCKMGMMLSASWGMVWVQRGCKCGCSQESAQLIKTPN